MTSSPLSGGLDGGASAPAPSRPAWLYRLLCVATLPLTVPLFAIHPRLRGQLRHRLGVLPRHVAAARGCIWYHGASAGDVNALLPLARLSVDTHPVAVSTFTRAGAQLLEARLDDARSSTIVRLRAPLELEGCVERFFGLLEPRLLVLECLELWPALVSAAFRRRIPVAVVNGRLSPLSLDRYRRWRRLFAPLFAGLSQVTALDDGHAERFIQAGVSPSRLAVASSTKHGHLLPPHVGVGGASVVLGSLHAREAELLLPPLLAGLPRRKTVLVAPRYPSAAAAMERVVRRQGWGVRRYNGQAPAPGEVGILDQVGGLAGAYAGAEVAFVGGSLIPRGGHNVIEAAAHGVPVVTGPYTDNCRREVALLRAAAAGRVAVDAQEAARWLVEHRVDLTQRERARSVAHALFEGAARVHARLLGLLA